MDRCALFIDAGYLLAEGGGLCLGTKQRAFFTCRIPELLKALEESAKTHCGLSQLLRTYWYDGAFDGVPSSPQREIARLSNVKIRIGRLGSTGKQKGVDALLVRDLIILAHERAMAYAYVLSGDEDIREGVRAAQDVGIRVILWGIPPSTPLWQPRPNQADTLIQEADEHIVLLPSFWAPYFLKRAVAPMPGAPAEAAIREETGQGGEMGATSSANDVLELEPVQSPQPPVSPPTLRGPPLESFEEKVRDLGRQIAQERAEKMSQEELQELGARSLVPFEIDRSLVSRAGREIFGGGYIPEAARRVLRRSFLDTIKDLAKNLEA